MGCQLGTEPHLLSASVTPSTFPKPHTPSANLALPLLPISPPAPFYEGSDLLHQDGQLATFPESAATGWSWGGGSALQSLGQHPPARRPF